MIKDDDYIASIIACREMLDAQPVPARVQYMGEDDDDDTQVYKKPWVGLTDEDCKGMSAGDKVTAMWVNRILKEKNS